MNIFLDIETLPCQDAALRAELDADAADKLARDLEAVCAPGNYKNESTIASYVLDKQESMRAEFKEDRETAYRKTSLDGATGSICVIGMAFHNEAAISIDSALQPERGLLNEMMGILDKHITGTSRPCFIGHNITGFDLRFLWQRCVILGARPSMWLPTDAKPWDTNRVYDTMVQWSPDRDKRISLARLCRALGVPTSKGDLDGSKVWDYWQAGKHAEVAAYCRADVDATRECHRRMVFA